MSADTTAAAGRPLPSHLHYGVMWPLIKALEALVQPGQMLLWRDATCWNNSTGILGDHPEDMNLPELCAAFGYEVIHDFNHVAVVKLPVR